MPRTHIKGINVINKLRWHHLGADDTPSISNPRKKHFSRRGIIH